MSEPWWLDQLYPLARGTEQCVNCGNDTTTTNAWGTPWCEQCWAAESIRSTGDETPANRGVKAPSGFEPLFPSAEPKADR